MWPPWFEAEDEESPICRKDVFGGGGALTGGLGGDDAGDELANAVEEEGGSAAWEKSFTLW